MSALADDSRWQKLVGLGGLDEIAFGHPDAWPHGPRGELKTLELGDDSLSESYCTLAGHRFLRVRLGLPIIGAPQVLAFSCWASVSDETWAAVLGARTGGAAFEGGFAWLSNALPGFEAGEPVGCNLMPARPGEAPRLFAQAGAIHDAQQSGIDIERVLEINAAAGQDLRAKLVG